MINRKYIEDRQKRRDRMEVVKEAVDLYEKVMEGGKKDDRTMQTYIGYLKELAALKRIDRSEEDSLYFTYEYFSESRNPDNNGNLIDKEEVKLEDAADFHIELTGILNIVSNEEPNKRVAWSAPRGHAKSAYMSNIFPIHQTVFNKRRYILIISETDSAAKKFIEWLSNELKFNEKLRNDYGDILSPNKGENGRDSQEAFMTSCGTLVESASIGKQLRGKRNGAHRPDLVIADDLESSKNTNTPELVEKNIHWYNSVVMPIGDPDKTAFVYMGTMVVAEGLLQSVMKRTDFESKKFAAIVEESDRGDLWDEYETILQNQDDEYRKDKAEAFYLENKDEMDAGTKVLWADRWNYKALIDEKVNIGSRSFNSEYMNNPIDTENAIFKPDDFTYFTYEEKHEKERFFEYFASWDIAMGKNRRSDYNAIVTVARDKRSGVFYVVDAWAKKCPAHIALEVALDKMEKYGTKVFIVETVGAQFDLYRQLRQAMPKRGVYRTKLLPQNQTSNKESRIEMLEPLIENGALRFMYHQKLLLEQLEQFPNASHDDLPDALQMAVEAATKMRRMTHYKKPTGI